VSSLDWTSAPATLPHGQLERARTFAWRARLSDRPVLSDEATRALVWSSHAIAKAMHMIWISIIRSDAACMHSYVCEVRWANAWPAWPMTSAGEGVSDGGDKYTSHALGEIGCDSFAPTPTRTCGKCDGAMMGGRRAGLSLLLHALQTNSHSIPTSLTHAVLLVDFPRSSITLNSSHPTHHPLFATLPFAARQKAVGSRSSFGVDRFSQRRTSQAFQPE
jgi:hypothetical protein